MDVAIPDTPEMTWDKHIENTLNELMRLYRENIRVLEERFAYDSFRPSWFSESIVQKKPFITFLGPFSAGKSTFINYLMQSNYLLTGPQPVTDKFTVIMHGDEIQQVPGRVLIADTSQPFRGLSQFGDSFVECFQGVLAPHPILQSVSMIDTPGVLEAAGDIHSRRYDYVKVCRWFVEKSDLVFFLFDPTKLDAGMELRMLFKHALRGFENKIRIILNKADTVGPQELMRVYGALFWNLSNLINTTEPPRVYVSSFWDKPYKEGTNHELFTDEKSDLLYDLTEVVPLQSLDKRVTSVLRRAQEVLIHSLVCATLRSKMPRFFGKDKAKKEQMAKLPETYQDISEKHRMSVNDFSDPEDYERFFAKHDLMEMPDIEKCNKKGWIAHIKKTIDVELPMLLKPIKAGPVIDPRDRKHAIMLQRSYQQGLAEQLSGQAGIQGGMGEAAAPVWRQETMPNAMSMQQQMMQQQMMQQQPATMQQQQPQMMQQPQQQQQPMMMMMGGGGGALPPAAAAPMDPAAQMQMMMMQAQLQQQQQQQQQQQMHQQMLQQQQPQMDPMQMQQMLQMKIAAGATPASSPMVPTPQPSPATGQPPTNMGGMTPEQQMQMMMMMQSQQQQQAMQ